MSITLSLAQLHAKAGVSTSPAFVKDRICHNGAKEDSQGSRLCNCLAEVNNFPTTAGLASSAAGYDEMSDSVISDVMSEVGSEADWGGVWQKAN